MSEVKFHVLVFFLPLIIGNILHMVIVKKDLFSSLKIPLSVILFGKNKTVRGFLILPVLTGTVAYLISIWFGPMIKVPIYDVFVGFGLGLVYMLFELPNSFIKRRLGIANGEQSGSYKYLQILMDKCDSLIGVLLFYYWAASVPFKSILILFVIALAVHLSLSALLVGFKIKKSI